MFCGDETGAIVIDVGAQNARFGYAGDDLPKVVFNTYTGVTSEAVVGAGASSSDGSRRKYHVGPAARTPRPGMEVKSPFDIGLVDDFDMLGSIWSHGLRELRVDPSKHPLIIVEPSHSYRQHREEMVRLAFELFNPPAVYLARAPVMQAFAVGRANALVVDIGASGTRVVGVHDGHILKQSTVISEVGGTAISYALHEALVRSGQLPNGELLPRVLLKKSQVKAGMDVDRVGAGIGTSTASGTSAKYAWDVQRRTDLPGLTRSFKDAWTLELLDDIKKSCCSVCPVELHLREASDPAPSDKKYELPDGTMLLLKEQQEVASELLFCPKERYRDFQGSLNRLSTQAWHSLYALDIIKRESPYVHPPSIGQMVYSSLLSVPVDIRRELCSNIVLTGGGSLLRGIANKTTKEVGLSVKVIDKAGRLYWDVKSQLAELYTPRVLDNGAPMEREFGSWIGASLLASLGTFQQMWIARSEFEESGAASVLDQRCL